MFKLFNAAAIAALAIGVGVAQGPPDQSDKGRMSKEMMGKGMGTMGKMKMMGVSGMMQDPVHQAVLTVFALPEMQTELGLSAQQEDQLRQAKQDLVTKGKPADSPDVVAKMKASLTQEQLTKLEAMKPSDIHSFVMAHIAEADMKQMMQFMGGDKVMMGTMEMKGMKGMKGTPEAAEGGSGDTKPTQHEHH